jgi:hypothetical protein
MLSALNSSVPGCRMQTVQTAFLGNVCLSISLCGGIEAFFLDFLTLEDGTTVLSLNCSKELLLYAV